MAGLDSTGYTILSLGDILDNLKAKAVELFQDLVPEGDSVNTGDTSTLGRMIGVISPALSDVWEASQELHDAFNLDNATGVALDNLVVLGGVVRKPASATTTTVILGGDVGVTVPFDTTVGSTNNNKQHTTLEAVVFDKIAASGITVEVLTVSNSTVYSISYLKVPDTLAEGVVTVSITSDSSATASEILTALASAINTSPHNTVLSASISGTSLNIVPVDVTKKITFSNSANLNVTKSKKLTTVVCTETGVIEQPIGTITKIMIPILGWDSVTNPSTGLVGGDKETDSQLKARYKIAKFGDGQNLIESLYSALYALDGVVSVGIIENDTDTTLTTPNPPVPPHSFYVIVQGGETEAIGRAIWNNKPAGILSYGATSTTVLDSQGIGHTVSFDRPTSIDIYVTVSITVLENFAPDGSQQIKDALVAHFNNLVIGEDVIYSRLYTPINSVVGHYVNSLNIGTSPSPSSTSNISIAFNEKASITDANINVVIV